MAAIASHGSNVHETTELTRESALKTAWYGYLVMLVAPFLLFLFVAWSMMDSTSRRNVSFADGWFLIAVGYMITIVPASFFLRSRSFAEYWRGGSVSPRNYVLGMYVVWVALEIAGIVSLAVSIMLFLKCKPWEHNEE